MNTVESLSAGLGQVPGGMLDDDAFLRANDEAYRWMAGRAQASLRRERVDEALAHVVAAAGFAADFHAGRFADGAIENIALEIGRREPDGGGLGAAPGRAGAPGRRRRVIHVASHMVSISGTSRMLHRWVCRDRSSAHSLVLTAQGALELPPWLLASLRESGGSHISLPDMLTLREKALRLREAVRHHADLVILHHSSSDVVPILAFAVENLPPVVVLNHADHVFWLGSSVADAVINLRSKTNPHSQARRYIDTNLVLPVPLDEAPALGPRRAARAALGIPADQIVLLSIGRGAKYMPCGNFDFVATANRILERVPQAHLYVAGESREGIAPWLRVPPHERLHFVGAVEDPSAYRAAADVYLESFPFGSQTALLESALMALPVVPAYAPLFELLVAQDDAIADLMPTPQSEQEYVARAVALACDPARRVREGIALRERLVQAHVGDGWVECLQAVYAATDRLVHAPAPIPACGASFLPSDIGLSLWHARPDGRSRGALDARNAACAAAFHGSYVAWRARHMAACRRYAWQALRHQPTARESWRLVGLSLLGPSAHRLRSLLQPQP